MKKKELQKNLSIAFSKRDQSWHKKLRKISYPDIFLQNIASATIRSSQFLNFWQKNLGC
jgi:hypothetical protein